MKTKSQTQTSTSQNESAWKHRAIAAKAECDRLRNTLHIMCEPKCPKTENLGRAKSAPLVADEKISLSGIGQISGIPLPRETLALIALKRIYEYREQIIQNVALERDPEFINEAQEITQALLIAENLLHQAGIRTELDHVNPSVADLRYTFLQVADDVLHSNTPMPAIPEQCELLSTVNKQFRPWIKASKTAATR